MQTHMDQDVPADTLNQFDRLKERAKTGRKHRLADITAGKPGEKALAEWEHDGLQVRQMPDDEQGILRISVGGGVSWANIEYCVFRGDRTQCAYRLEQAAKALRNKPE